MIPLSYSFEACFNSTYPPLVWNINPKGYKTILFGIKILLDLHLAWIVMQVNVKNTFDDVSWIIIIFKLRNVKGPLVNIVPFTKLFYDVHSSLYYLHGQHEEGVTIIESFLSTRRGDPLGGPLFALAHYRTLLKTITQAPDYVFQSLTDKTHIVGPMNKIISLPLTTFQLG